MMTITKAIEQLAAATLRGEAPAPEVKERLEAFIKAENEASARRRENDERWARDMTDPMDNCLSVWAQGATCDEANARLKVIAAGGLADCPGLYAADGGPRVRAKLIPTRYGVKWAICDENGDLTGDFLPRWQEGRSRKLKALGLEERTEQAPVWPKWHATQLGSPGFITNHRLDGGYPESALPFEDVCPPPPRDRPLSRGGDQ